MGRRGLNLGDFCGRIEERTLFLPAKPTKYNLLDKESNMNGTIYNFHHADQEEGKNPPNHQQNFGYLCKNDTQLYHLGRLCPFTGDLRHDLEELWRLFQENNQDDLEQKMKLVEDASPLEKVALQPPIPRPIHDIICVGMNYQDHIEECTRGLNFQAPEVPTFFSKRACKIFTHGETLPSYQGLDEKIDYEVELAVVIGKGGTNIAPEQVKDHILGYAVFNDFSARTLQKETSQWSRGKSLDGLSAMGLELVPAQWVEYPPKRAIRSYVNGELRQESTTDNVRFDLDAIISTFSQGTTLEPGDILITGTPAGVAMGMEEPKWLKKGDVVRCEIDGIGVLENTIG